MGWKRKVSSNDAKQPESRGGLNFLDIQSSWSAFIFSWFRRIVNSNSE